MISKKYHIITPAIHIDSKKSIFTKDYQNIESTIEQYFSAVAQKKIRRKIFGLRRGNK
jgi:uncharacterized membrane protein